MAISQNPERIREQWKKPKTKVKNLAGNGVPERIGMEGRGTAEEAIYLPHKRRAKYGNDRKERLINRGYFHDFSHSLISVRARQPLKPP